MKNEFKVLTENEMLFLKGGSFIIDLDESDDDCIIIDLDDTDDAIKNRKFSKLA